jgi:hypothetical protein
MGPQDAGQHWGPLGQFTPSDDEIAELIRRAEDHEFGLDFLSEGAQDAVAATFGVHAFVVDEARRRLQR